MSASAVRGVSGLLPTQACPCRKEDGLTTNMMKYRIRNGWVKTAHFRDANQSQNKNISNFELLHLSDYYNLDNVTVFNPRRDDFDVTDKNAEIEQIKWEHSWLTRCDIFSCFFEASESIQPITLYELGRYAKNKNYDPVITVQKGYLRERDVLIQTAIDKLPVNYISGEDAILQHARSIAQRIQEAKR